MTDEDLSKLRAIADGATPGPWRAAPSRTGVVSAADDWWVCTVNRVTPVLDVEFIAASRGAVPALLDEVERLREENRVLTNKMSLTQGVSDKILEDLVDVEILRAAITEAIDIFDATWCPEFGHAPKPEQIERMAELRHLVADEVNKLEERRRRQP